MNDASETKSISKTEWILGALVILVFFVLMIFVDTETVKYSMLFLIPYCIYCLFFKKGVNFESQFTLSLLFLMIFLLELPKKVPLETVSLAFGTVAIVCGVDSAGKKQDKCYIILIGAIIVLMYFIIFGKFL